MKGILLEDAARASSGWQLQLATQGGWLIAALPAWALAEDGLHAGVEVSLSPGGEFTPGIPCEQQEALAGGPMLEVTEVSRRQLALAACEAWQATTAMDDGRFAALRGSEEAWRARYPMPQQGRNLRLLESACRAAARAETPEVPVLGAILGMIRNVQPRPPREHPELSSGAAGYLLALDAGEQLSTLSAQNAGMRLQDLSSLAVLAEQRLHVLLQDQPRPGLDSVRYTLRLAAQLAGRGEHRERQLREHSRSKPQKADPPGADPQAAQPGNQPRIQSRMPRLF